MAGRRPKHNLAALKARSLSELDGRSRAAKGLIAWKRELAESIGGQPSPQELMVIELCCRNRMILDSIDSWLFQQKCLLNKKKKSVLPIVRERQAIDAALARHLQSLGLSRREPPTPTLDAYLREHYPAQDEAANEPAPARDDNDAPAVAVAPGE
jgi:hypothetical protein